MEKILNFILVSFTFILMFLSVFGEKIKIVDKSLGVTLSWQLLSLIIMNFLLINSEKVERIISSIKTLKIAGIEIQSLKQEVNNVYEDTKKDDLKESNEKLRVKFFENKGNYKIIFLENFIEIEKTIRDIGYKMGLKNKSLNLLFRDIIKKNNEVESLTKEIMFLIDNRNKVVHGMETVFDSKLLEDEQMKILEISEYSLENLRKIYGEMN
ncbi:hypothetical protein [Cetobacterium sp.]|uniref:hypothetical protein n=1 Tax=Cetobacterium sp. TaxID=2071632 RepID=UPI003F2DEBF2